eukprot:5428294-Prymnesium_polylepis.2
MLSARFGDNRVVQNCPSSLNRKPHALRTAIKVAARASHHITCTVRIRTGQVSERCALVDATPCHPQLTTLDMNATAHTFGHATEEYRVVHLQMTQRAPIDADAASLVSLAAHKVAFGNEGHTQPNENTASVRVSIIFTTTHAAIAEVGAAD